MLLVLLIFFLLWAALAGLLWAGTAAFQDYIYSEPAGQLHSRAPAAAAVVTAWLAVWSYLDARNPGRYAALFDFSATEVTKFDELWVMKDNQKHHYRASSSPSKLSGMKGSLPGRVEFRETAPPHRVWSRSDAVIVKDGDQEIRFVAERDNGKHYKAQPGGDLRYIDDRGRVMTEGNLGRIYTFRWGTFLTYVMLNAVLLLVWFASLWLLLRFQWSHALGLAVAFWAAMIILLIPLLLAQVETARRPAPTQVAVSLR